MSLECFIKSIGIVKGRRITHKQTSDIHKQKIVFDNVEAKKTAYHKKQRWLPCNVKIAIKKVRNVLIPSNNQAEYKVWTIYLVMEYSFVYDF